MKISHAFAITTGASDPIIYPLRMHSISYTRLHRIVHFHNLLYSRHRQFVVFVERDGLVDFGHDCHPELVHFRILSGWTQTDLHLHLTQKEQSLRMDTDMSVRSGAFRTEIGTDSSLCWNSCLVSRLGDADVKRKREKSTHCTGYKSSTILMDQSRIQTQERNSRGISSFSKS